MGEVIFEVFFETFSKHLHLFGMGMGILQPQTKNFSSLVHNNMYSIKNYPLTLNAKKSREIWPYVKKSFKKICPFTYTQWERSFFKSVSKIFAKKITSAEKQTIHSENILRNCIHCYKKVSVWNWIRATSFCRIQSGSSARPTALTHKRSVSTSMRFCRRSVRLKRDN